MQSVLKTGLVIALFALSALLTATLVFQAQSAPQYVVSSLWDADPTIDELFAHPLLYTVVIGQVIRQVPVAGHLLESDLRGGQMPYVEVTVAITEYLVNRLPYKEIKVLIPGGPATVTGEATPYQVEVVMDDRDMQTGENVLLFLGKDDSMFSLPAEAFTLMYGSTRGLWHITNNNVHNQRETVTLEEVWAIAKRLPANGTPTPLPKGFIIPTSTPATDVK